MLPQVVKFADVCVNLCPRGDSSFVNPDYSTAVRTETGTLLWDPAIPGLLGGVGVQRTDSDHGGERHLDGDELLYVMDGHMRLVLLDGDGAHEEVHLVSGDAVLVPRGRWHRLAVDRPTAYLSLGGGRTEIRTRDGV